MKRFIGVAAGMASLLFSYPGSRRATTATGVGVATGITAASLNGRSDTTRD